MTRSIRTPRLRRLCGAFVAASTLAACARWFQSAPQGPTDANLGAMLLAANNTDISYAQLASSHTQNSAVIEFASRMITDHTAVNTQATALFRTINLTPVENGPSLDFRDESAAKRDTLRELSGHAFDSTYAMNEVAYHTKLLQTLDQVLIPDAKDADLKKMFTGVRSAVAAHLEHAQRMRMTVLGR